MAKAAKPAPKEARIPEHVAYFRNKENRPSYDLQEVAPEEHAFVFTVAKATSADVLTTIRAEVDAAIARGETVEMFKAKLEPKLIALGWWGKKEEVDPKTGEIRQVQLGSPRRLETIYWANTRTAYAAGQWERAQKAKKTLPYFLYGLGPSEVHRPQHERLEGTILPVDDPFWDSYFPPNGWGCKCWVGQVTKTEADKLGYDPQKPAPDLGTQTYTNTATGETMRIPAGIDPGWESNPGKLRQEVLARHVAGKLDGAPPEIARVVARDVISSQQFQKIQAREVKGVAPVGVLPEAVQTRLGADSRTVLFSSDTAAKQAGERRDGAPGNASRGHPDVAREDYVKLQSMLDDGEMVGDKANHLRVIKQIDGQWWNAVIKRTGDGREVYLQSLHRARKADIDRYRRQQGNQP